MAEKTEPLSKVCDPPEGTPASLMPGARVFMTSKHPHAGKSGTVDRWERTPWGPRPVIKLDDGDACFAIHGTDLRPERRHG